ncbi:MAG: right-handed parallel beta-helix repeat-containing protein, partial [Promethearchaeota archaeon]
MHDRVSSCILLLTLFMFLLALTPVADFEGTVTPSATVVSELENRGICLAGMPHGPITIDGDADFSATALLEGWPGDGSPENTFIIDGLDIDLGGNYGSCITIINTQVSFIIRNCRLTGADSRDWWSGGLGAGILLRDVSNCELVNNKCYSNLRGIFIETSDSITLFNNTCNNNGWGIWLADSDFSTVFNNTCNSNAYDGISLPGGYSNTVSDNICNSNSWGIWQVGSFYNMVMNNTCNSNEFHGIELGGSYFNMVSDNTCNNNTQYGIYINDSEFNTVSNNICNNNQFSIYLEESHRSIVANNICNNNGIGIYVRASDNNTVADNTCTSNGRHGFYLSDSSYNNMTNNICNNNWIGICLNNSYWNTVVNNTCNDNRIGIYLYESYYNTVASNTCFNNNEHDILEEFESGKFVPSVLLLVGLLGITPMAIVVLGPGLRKAFEAWQLEEKKRREAYDEERRRWEADQEARLVEERQKRRYKDDITYPGEVRRFTIILRGRSIDLSFWIKMVVIIFILFIIPIEFSYWSSESNGVIWIDSVIIDYYDEEVWSNAQIAFSNPSTIAAAFAICLPAIVLNRRIRNQRAT